MQKLPLTALAIALLALCTGCTAFQEAHDARVELRMQHVAKVLANGSSADSLSAAALLGFSKSPGLSLSLMGRATSAAPDRPDLVWLQIQMCQSQPPCDPLLPQLRLQTLDASNGAGWVGALSRADSANDGIGRTVALAAIGHAERFDIYWTALIGRLGRAVADTRAVPVAEAEVRIIGLVASLAIPAYKPISDACEGERLQHAETVEVCRAVARALEHGDTYITEMLGVAIAKRVWAEDSPEWKAATEARRLYEYRTRFLPSDARWIASHADETLRLCAQHRREQDVLLAQLVARGENPNPPSE
jgi:hypothetical protein